MEIFVKINQEIDYWNEFRKAQKRKIKNVSRETSSDFIRKFNEHTKLNFKDEKRVKFLKNVSRETLYL